ncbi:MAG: VOC family protein [Cyclobacteriaceae bacterium]
MNKNILGLRTVIYYVPDLDKAKEWYAMVFGKPPYFDEPFYVGFEIGGYELGLLPEKEPIENKTVNVETYWGVEDIELEHKRFIELGATEHTPVTNVGGPLLVSTLFDPWQNVIGLIYNPLFKLP